ncbi:MAG: hypothetical protein E7183_01270 [Erysipelotrichaceae bacterium]|nr:hypothetical protein [Erysipelotrichaceae bacterium]
MKYFLVGIKGTGMSGLAIFLKEAGHEVVGSDNSNYYFTVDELNNNDIEIKEYNKNNIKNDCIYIIGLSIKKDNVEFSEILNRDLEYYYYNDFIGEFIDKKMIAVSGTHGKTTTCHIIKELSNISYIIGCGNGGCNESEYFVLEACEYKNHFHSYSPELLLILNMDIDHPDFFKNKKDVINSYQGMCDRSKVVLVNGDDKLSKYLVHSNIYTYGFSEGVDYQIKLIESSVNGYKFLLKGKGLCRFLKCNLVGIHNLYNYVGAYLACLLSYLKINQYVNITLPKRRMTSYKYGNSVLIDDYAHHPTEINALLESLKIKYDGYKINCIFQSHTYSRTIKYRNEFKKVLKKFDDVYLLDVFSSAREKEGVLMQKRVNRYFRKFKKYDSSILESICESNKEVWVFLGAGTSNELLETFKKEHFNAMKM